jgi:hypothetical protein
MAVGLLIPLWVAAARGQEPTALDRLRTDTGATAGKLKEVDLNPPKAAIAAPAEVAPAQERPVLTPLALRPPPAPPVGALDQELLETEVTQHLPDLEVCRAIPPSKGEAAPAGLAVLRWTIMSDGHTKGTVVYQKRPTDIELMGCMRRRMEAWTFTPPTGGPVQVEQVYRLASPPVATEAPQAPKKPDEVNSGK